MNSHHSRRKFLRGMGMAAGASVAGTGWIMGEPRSARRTGLAQRSLSKVISFANTYGDDICLCGISGAVQATGGKIQSSVNMLVSVSDTEQLVHTLRQEKGLPFSHVRAEGNNLTFRYSDREYFVENLAPADYANRVRNINTYGLDSDTKNTAYAHNYLTYEVNSKKLNDPYQAVQGKKITLKKADGASQQLDFEDVITGMIECSVMGIEPSSAIEQEWGKILSNHHPDEPDSITSIFLKRLPDLVSAISDKKVEEVLRSAIVRSSLKSTLGISSQKIIAHFGALNSRSRRTRNSTHIWQAAFIAVCPEGSQNRLLQSCFLRPASASAKRTAHSRWRDAKRLKS